MQRCERQYHLQTSKEKRRKPLKSRNDKQNTVIQSQSEGSQEGQDTVQVNTDEEFIQHEDECNVLHDNPQVQSSEATIESCGDNSSELADQLVETTSTEQTFVVKKKDEGINTDFNCESWHTMEETIKFQQEIIASLSADLREALSHAKRLENDDEQTNYYTGLTSYALFDKLLDLLSTVSSKNPNSSKGKLCIKDQFLLVLMKLRTGATNKDLAYRFGISPGRVSQLFHEWIDVLSRESKQLIAWPNQEMIRKTLPECFKPSYARATCIIDCSEVFIQRATSLSARSETFSNYKSHNTAKFLVATSPTGAVILFLNVGVDGHPTN